MLTDQDGNKITLKEHIDNRLKHLEDRALTLENRKADKGAVRLEIKALREAIRLQMDALKEATNLVAINQKEKNAQQNEWREQSKDQTATYVTKDVYHPQIETISEAIRTLQDSKEFLAGKASQQSVYFALGLSGIGLILSVVKMFI